MCLSLLFYRSRMPGCSVNWQLISWTVIDTYLYRAFFRSFSCRFISLLGTSLEWCFIFLHFLQTFVLFPHFPVVTNIKQMAHYYGVIFVTQQACLRIHVLHALTAKCDFCPYERNLPLFSLPFEWWTRSLITICTHNNETKKFTLQTLNKHKTHNCQLLISRDSAYFYYTLLLSSSVHRQNTEKLKRREENAKKKLLPHCTWPLSLQCQHIRDGSDWHNKWAKETKNGVKKERKRWEAKEEIIQYPLLHSDEKLHDLLEQSWAVLFISCWQKYFFAFI